jgi:sensor domain CHASE-containing protein
MRKLKYLSILFIICIFTIAVIGCEQLSEKVQKKVEEKIDKTIDETIDKTMENLDSTVDKTVNKLDSLKKDLDSTSRKIQEKIKK